MIWGFMTVSFTFHDSINYSFMQLKLHILFCKSKNGLKKYFRKIYGDFAAKVLTLTYIQIYGEIFNSVPYTLLSVSVL